MKRVSIALILIIATVAFAGSPEPGRRVDLGAYLNLTTDQGIAWEAAEKSFRASAHPLYEQQGALQRELETMLASKADACSIGNQALKVSAIEDQVRAGHEALEQKIDAILTPDQRAKYAAMRAAGEMRERRAFPGIEPR